MQIPMKNVRPQGRYDSESRRSRPFVASVDSLIRRASFLIVACWLFSNPPRALSLNEETVEYPVKLGFLYNFTKFVEWPSDSYRAPGSPLAICIVGDDPFSSVLEGELRTRTVGGHPVEVRELKSDDTLSVCHMVFVPVTEKNHAATIVSNLKGSSTLTVGETEGFAEQGGMINLTVEENKVHFEVNPLAAERAGLKISSKLLSIAKIVKEKDQGHGKKS
jgi:hypothetical protein